MSTFRDLGLNPMILQAIEEIGFEKPTPIQAQTIPHLLNVEGDLVALAQTGTGKTAAFSLPIIQRLDESQASLQALVLCPTRELAIQVAKDIEAFMKYLTGFKVVAVFGGERIDKQIRALKAGPQIVVGTPGRVNDLIRRKVLKVNEIRFLALDEADEMLNMGFKDDLDDILKTMPEEKQVLLFSATMSREVRRIAANYMKDPKDITVGNKNEGSDNVQHFYYVVHERDRYQTLRRIADANPDIHGIVFCRTKRETQRIADRLIQDHYAAEAIHGDVSQSQRIDVMNRLRDKKVQLLVATDVAARGIDIDGLTHVINYNLPEKEAAYVHRSGRTGRAHNKGISLVIVNMREKFKVKALERKIGKTFEQAKIPSGEDICEKQLFSLIDKVSDVEVNEAQIGKYLDVIAKKFEGMEREELIKKFVSVEFNRFLEYYKDAVDLNSRAEKVAAHEAKKASILFARFKMNFGKDMGLNIKELFQFINSQPELKGCEIGDIDIQPEYTVFEIDEKFEKHVMQAFNGGEVDGFKIKIECEERGIPSSGSFKKKIKHKRRSGGRRRRKRF